MKTCLNCHTPSPDNVKTCPACQSHEFEFTFEFESNTRKIINWYLILSIAVFIASTLTPAYTTNYHGTLKLHYGFEALILGPIGLFTGHFSWLSNMFTLFSWIQMKRNDHETAAGYSFMAILIGLTFLLYKKIAVGSAGNYPYTVSIGYYLWLTSPIIALVSSVIKLLKGKFSNTTDQP